MFPLSIDDCLQQFHELPITSSFYHSRARLLIAIRTEITDNVEILPEKNGNGNNLFPLTY